LAIGRNFFPPLVFFCDIGYSQFMNARGCLWLLLAGLGTGALLRAGDNPYSPIVERNVFALVPIPVHNPADDAPPAPPPPKITPNGIMNVFGKLQAMFVAKAPDKPGQPGKDQSYVLCAGERQDDIEVVKIDEANATITFNNHGTIQDLPLVAGNASSGSAPPSAIPGGPVGIPRPGLPGMAPGGGPSPIGFGGRFGRNRPGTSQPGANPNPAPPNFGGGTPANFGQNNQEQITPEAQVLMMEANRLATQEAVNKGFMPPLPPTPITPPDATGVGGVPLVNAPPIPGGAEPHQ
jgi:hypothetical protein